MTKILLAVWLLGLLDCICASSEPQREAILFEKVDKDLDGSLTHAELDSVFLLFDANHDNVITRAEFDSDWTTTYQLGNLKEANLLFEKADANDDGVIDHKDLPFIFHFFDTDNDGNVSIDEFLTQWGSLTLTASEHNNTTDTTTVATTMGHHIVT